MSMAETVNALIFRVNYNQLHVVSLRIALKHFMDYPMFTMNVPTSSSTAFQRAITIGSTELVQLLLDAGADPDIPNDDLLPISFAAYANKTEIVRLFIKHGAKLQNEKSSALAYAIYGKHQELALELIAVGADINFCDSDGHTVLESAKRSNLKEVAEAIETRLGDGIVRDRPDRLRSDRLKIPTSDRSEKPTSDRSEKPRENHPGRQEHAPKRRFRDLWRVSKTRLRDLWRRFLAFFSRRSLNS
jgi:hypothetical protein